MYNIKISRLLALSVTTAISLTTTSAIGGIETRTGFGGSIIDALEIGDLSKVQNLISNGANPNERGEFGTTPLMRAVQNNNIEMVSVLLERGADTNISDVGGATAVSIAVRLGYNDILASLLKRGGNVNSTDNEGFTPLMRAALSNNTLAVQELINAGANVNIANNFGDTALSQATRDGKSEIVTILKNGGADDSLKTSSVKKEVSRQPVAVLDDDGNEQADIVVDFSNGKLNGKATAAQTYAPVVRQVAQTSQPDYFASSYYVSAPAREIPADKIELPSKPNIVPKPQLLSEEKNWMGTLRQVAKLAASPYQLSSNEMMAPMQLTVIDLGSYKNVEFANRKIEFLKKAFPSIFAELALKSVPQRNAAGISYQLNAGLTNSENAATICKQLIATGINYHPQVSKMLSQQEFNNYSGDAPPTETTVLSAKVDGSTASPNPQVAIRRLAPANDNNAGSAFGAYAAELTPAAGETVPAENEKLKSLPPISSATTPTPVPTPTPAPTQLKIITPVTNAPTPVATPTPVPVPASSAVTTVTTTKAATPVPVPTPTPTPTPVTTTTTTTTTTAPVPHAVTPEVKTEVKTEVKVEDSVTETETVKPVKKKRFHRKRAIPAAGIGQPPKDLSTGQPLAMGADGKFEVARPVKSAEIHSPIPFAQQVWIKISNFINEAGAQEFWDNLRNEPSFANMHMRTNTNVTRPDLVSLEVGPFASTGAAQDACSTVTQSGIHCGVSNTLPPRTVNLLPVDHAYVDDHNMPLVENYDVNGGIWNIQLGSYDSYEQAQDAWNDAVSQDKHLKKIKKDIVSTNGKFRLRAGNFTSSSAADALCDKLRAKAISCIIIKS